MPLVDRCQFLLTYKCNFLIKCTIIFLTEEAKKRPNVTGGVLATRRGRPKRRGVGTWRLDESSRPTATFARTPPGRLGTPRVRRARLLPQEIPGRDAERRRRDAFRPTDGMCTLRKLDVSSAKERLQTRHYVGFDSTMRDLLGVRFPLIFVCSLTMPLLFSLRMPVLVLKTDNARKIFEILFFLYY